MGDRVVWDRRKFLAGTSAAAITASAGCLGEIFGCGPGDTRVDRILSRYDRYVGESVTLKGEVTFSSDSNRIFIINDTTGEAVVGGGTRVESGRCVDVTATVVTEDEFSNAVGGNYGRTYVHMLRTGGSSVTSG